MSTRGVAITLMLAGAPATAQVTHVNTIATVTATNGFDVNGNPLTQVFTGTTLADNVSTGQGGGSGSSFKSTSSVDSNGIFFANSNASAGDAAFLDSYTVVDIAFRNDGPMAVRPSLESTIIPAGIGLYVGANCITAVVTCGPGGNGRFPLRTFADFGPGMQASFDFLVRDGSTILYELKGSLGWALNATTGQAELVQDLDDAAASLLNFRLSSPVGSDTLFGFEWDATPIIIQYPAGYLLAPGQTTVLTYETRVTTTAGSPCTSLLSGQCLVAYSSFGDPLGRGRGGPSLSAARFFAINASGDDPQPLQFDTFRFALPTFEDGVLSYKADLVAAVPEPATWMSLILGFGLIGSMLRRQRGRVPV